MLYKNVEGSGGIIMARMSVKTMQANAEKALKKAVKKAIARYELAGVPAVVWRDGKVVRLPSSARSERRR